MKSPPTVTEHFPVRCRTTPLPAPHVLCLQVHHECFAEVLRQVWWQSACLLSSSFYEKREICLIVLFSANRRLNDAGITESKVSKSFIYQDIKYHKAVCWNSEKKKKKNPISFLKVDIEINHVNWLKSFAVNNYVDIFSLKLKISISIVFLYIYT